VATQFSFFDDKYTHDESAAIFPEGLRYRPALIDSAEENALVARMRELSFREFEFHGFLGKRRVVSFGWQYDYSGGGLRKAERIPDFLLELRARAAAFANQDTEVFQQVLVTEYGPGAGIGWHRDKPVFGEVVGVSFLAPCVLRFRRKKLIGGSASNPVNLATRLSSRKKQSKPDLTTTSQRNNAKTQWDRVNVNLEPRSAYHLSGPARHEWYHSILRVDALRYAITFRSVLNTGRVG
jgi:alkylated DNA repair dioxygenase AlkB